MTKGFVKVSLPIASTILVTTLVVVTSVNFPALASNNHVDVTICHATGSNNNPYTKITVDDDAVDGNGNGDHNRDGHQNGQDIIPAGSWDSDGRNWDAAHIAIYNNDCNSVQASPSPSVSPSPSPSVSPSPSPQTQLGSITVCKVIVDQNDTIVDGSTKAGAIFTISGILPAQTSELPPTGQIGSSQFTSPLNLNSKVFNSSNSNDSQCTTYGNLIIGSYYYGEENINPSVGWQSPKYNDQHTTPVASLSDFFNYDSNLFDTNAGNDASRNMNADGHIILTNTRPDRILVVLNKMANGGSTATSPTPTPSPAVSPSSTPTPSPSPSPSPTPTPSPSTGGSSSPDGGSASNNNSSGGGTVLGTSTGPQVLAETGSLNEQIMVLGFGMIMAGVWLLTAKSLKQND